VQDAETAAVRQILEQDGEPHVGHGRKPGQCPRLVTVPTFDQGNSGDLKRPVAGSASGCSVREHISHF
jgi:hypothetical protein